MMTPVDSYNTTHVTTEEKRHQHALVVNKKSMINRTLAVVFFMCAEKSGSGERESDKS